MTVAWRITVSVIVLGVTSVAAREFAFPGSAAVVAVGVAVIGLLWLAGYRDGAKNRAAEARLRAEHPGATLERVNLWSLPAGRVDKLPRHAILVDPKQIVFETLEGEILLTVPVADIDLLDVLTAAGDRTRDRAVTILYGEPQQTVQFFTLTHAGQELLADRVRKWAELGDRARP